MKKEERREGRTERGKQRRQSRRKSEGWGIVWQNFYSTENLILLGTHNYSY